MKFFKSEKNQFFEKHFETSKKARNVQIYEFSRYVSLIITGGTKQLTEVQ